jgi:hypothetical protein
MNFEELQAKLFDLLNECKDMPADTVMGAVAMVYERTKYHYAMSIRSHDEKFKSSDVYEESLKQGNV